MAGNNQYFPTELNMVPLTKGDNGIADVFFMVLRDHVQADLTVAGFMNQYINISEPLTVRSLKPGTIFHIYTIIDSKVGVYVLTYTSNIDSYDLVNLVIGAARADVLHSDNHFANYYSASLIENSSSLYPLGNFSSLNPITILAQIIAPAKSNFFTAEVNTTNCVVKVGAQFNTVANGDVMVVF